MDIKFSTTDVTIHRKEYPFNYRPDSAGDKGTIAQIFRRQSHDFSGWVQGKRLIEYHGQQSNRRPSLIVDAGANIGASVLYFLKTFENSFVFSLEPDLANWQLCEMNTAAHANKINFQGAISNSDGELELYDPGHSDWGYRTRPPEGERTGNPTIVKSISPASILSRPEVADTTPLIFKVDIEGGERDLFSGDTAWMNRFPLIIIELHDWMLPFSGSSKSFLKAIGQYDFDVLHRDDNFFFFNRAILWP